MTRRELVDTIRGVTKDIYTPAEARNIALMVSEHITGVSRTQLIADPDCKVIVDGMELLSACDRLSAQEPVQYLLGVADFYGMSFKVTPAVLIPRPETEELVKWISDTYGTVSEGLRILDIGTGSGAIAVTLSNVINGSRVTALDVSEAALQVAGKNAGRNYSGAEIEFIQADILRPLDGTPLKGRYFDVIVSNPPYIPESERAGMHGNVTGYEPATALFVPDGDPLLFYREIGLKGLELLVPGGELYFETHENYAELVACLLVKLGYCEVEVNRDINGKQRMVRCAKAGV